ncbi:exodeoxyribonuclease V subunit gamma [Edwardsiella anguillarum]|nr:exodeoxyribonuclease V subunit gamma [Edwardsiella anguillarum]
MSDRSARQLHPVVQALLALLDLPHSRFNAEQVLALLEVPALAARFDIDDDGIRLLRHWVEESGIRWGWTMTRCVTWRCRRPVSIPGSLA